jgi:hypothetical protein
MYLESEVEGSSSSVEKLYSTTAKSLKRPEGQKFRSTHCLMHRSPNKKNKINSRTGARLPALPDAARLLALSSA